MTTESLTATAYLDGARIILESRQTFALAGFAKSLPYPRELRGRGWSCAATPYAAMRVMDEIEDVSLPLVTLALSNGISLPNDGQPPATKLPAWEHQCRAYWYAQGRASAGLFLGMGCGKTKVTADLLLNWQVPEVLIICPKAVVPVWPKELAKHYGGEFQCVTLVRGTTRDKSAQLKRAMLFADEGKLTAVVVNYETAWREPLAKELLDYNWPVVVLDESHKIKDPGGRASKFCAQLGLRAGRRLALSGTPMPHSPLDVFAQYRFLEPAIFGTSYVDFRGRYAVTHPEYKSKVLRWVNQEQLAEQIALCSIQITAAEAGLSLPPVQHIERPVVLEPATRRIYDRLEATMVAEIEDAGVAKCDNALTKLLRLQQVCCGFVGLEDEYGDRIVEELATEKADALAELLDEAAGERVVVFARFTHDLKMIEAFAMGAGLRYAELSGKRRELAPDATYPENVDVLGVQIQSGGAGIDLSKSAVAIFYSIGCVSHGDFDQACARLNRPGQTRPVRFYHLIAERSVDELAYKAIREGKEVVDFILHSMKQGTTT